MDVVRKRAKCTICNRQVGVDYDAIPSWARAEFDSAAHERTRGVEMRAVSGGDK